MRNRLQITFPSTGFFVLGFGGLAWFLVVQLNNQAVWLKRRQQSLAFCSLGTEIERFWVFDIVSKVASPELLWVLFLDG